MHHLSRPLRTLAITTLLALALAACGAGGAEPQRESSSSPASEPEATGEATTDPADATPQERIESFLDAADANAENGWTDSSYLEDYLTPERADAVRPSEEEKGGDGVHTKGARKLSHWTTVEETDTTAILEFCDDVSEITGIKDGEPYELGNPEEPAVAQYTLVRDDESSPWMIDVLGYYEEGTTCDGHFAD